MLETRPFAFGQRHSAPRQAQNPDFRSSSEADLYACLTTARQSVHNRKQPKGSAVYRTSHTLNDEAMSKEHNAETFALSPLSAFAIS